MNAENKTPGPQPQAMNMAYRQSGKAVLADNIARLRHRADELQILHDTLPEKLSLEQDAAIWSIACSLHRP